MKNRWMIKQTKADLQKMQQVLGITEATAAVLANRGIATRQQAMAFLKAEQAPFYDTLGQMKDAKKAIALLEEAILKGKKIAVYGDYDVDGVTSTSIWYKTIKACKGNVIYYIPHRQKEGYGLNVEAVEELHKKGIEVLLTCDNGIAALEEVKIAKQLQMEVIIADHHEPAFEKEGENRKDILPAADAIVDPKQRDCAYPFKMLCAGGLSYKLAMLLLKKMGVCHKALEEECLHLAALATVCDIVDLMEENRTIVKKGLKTMAQTSNIGLQALLNETGLLGKTLTEYHMGFVIGPCVNAAGRLETAKTAVALFCEDNMEKAREYARILTEQNNERKEMTKKAAQKLIEEAQKEQWGKENVLVAFEQSIHESIAGIVAGRVKERFYKPAIVITKAENMAKGSGRSIEGYNMFEELYACKDLFSKFGGHPMAAGLSIPYENIEALRKRLNDNCKLTQQQLMPVLTIEKELSFLEIDMNLAMELKTLAPFGKGNHVPLFGSKNVAVERFSIIGKEKNILRMILRQGGVKLSAISFDGLELWKSILKQLYGEQNCDAVLKTSFFEKNLDFVYHVDINTFAGESSVQLVLKDFRISR